MTMIMISAVFQNFSMRACMKKFLEITEIVFIVITTPA